MQKTPIAFVVLCVLCSVFAPAGVQAALLRLSTHASDGDSPPSADVLDAILDFSVVDSTLTLAVTNLTPENTGDPELKINEIYFNTKTNVSGLALTDVIGANKNQWALGFSEDGIQVNGFGLFDVSVIDGQGSVPHVINPGETLTFIIDIVGTGPSSDGDFIDLSTQVDHHIISYAAAKFYDGSPEMSAYGATNVPEPATIGLLGLGGLFLLFRKRRA